MQSISTIFSLALALGQVGGALWNHVGREPAGAPFNALVQLEEEKGKPRNPLINSGAIVVCDQLIGRDSPDEAVEEILDFLRERSGDESIGIDQNVVMSESTAGSLNRSLAHFIAASGNLINPVEDVLLGLFPPVRDPDELPSARPRRLCSSPSTAWTPSRRRKSASPRAAAASTH
jgi:glutaminase